MVKLLINNAMIVTMENEDSVIKNGYILIEDGLIKNVSEGKYTGNLNDVKIIDASGCAVFPGLINCHTHIAMTLLRGYGEGLPLMRWLNEKIWPFEAKLNAEDIYYGTMLGITEMIKSGTTAFVDMYFHEDEVGKACESAGIRGYLGSPLIGDNWQSQIEETLRLNEKYKNSELVKVMIAPHSPYTCNGEVIKQSGEIARKNKLPVHIHLSETMDEVKILKEKYNATSVQLCMNEGLFENNNVIAAHCVHVNDDDIKIMRDNKVNSVYNPQSNMKLASGVSPVNKMIKAGINVAIGTDGASSNNNLNLIEEMQTGSMLQKLSTGDATVLNAYETIKLATSDGAIAIGMGDRLGKIKEGYLADIILIDIKKPHMVPLYDIYTNVVFSAQGSDVKTVIINGKVIMEDYKLKTIDENIIESKADEKVREILSR